MKYRNLGRSNISVSSIGMGTWQLGGKGWQINDKKQFYRALEAARKAGITFFDTAAVYGFGQSEEIVGEIIGSDKEAIIASKCGLTWDEDGRVSHNLSYDSIFFQIDDSLKRLKRDYIDLYQVHWPDPATKMEDTFQALNQLVKEKVIRGIGVSNFKLNQLKKATSLTENLLTLQPLYNMFTRGIEEEIIPFCKEHQISILPYSPYCQGLLTGAIKEDYILGKKDARNNNINFTDKERFLRNIERVDQLKSLADKNNLTLHELNVLWLLSHTEIASIIGGSTTVKHIKQNAKISDMEISGKTISEIEKIIDHNELKEGISFNY